MSAPAALEVDPPRRGARSRPQRPEIVTAAVGIALLLYLAFSAGGFFPDVTAIAALVLLGVLLALVSGTAAIAALGPALAAGATLLGAFAVWQLASASWSDAPGRATLEFDRTLLYLLALLAGGLGARTASRSRALVLAATAGLAVPVLGGLVVRTLNDVVSVAPEVSNERLSWPVTYWNALGVMGAGAIVLCLGLSGSGRERPAVRTTTAAAVPALAAGVLLTFSRGSIAAGLLGVLALVVLAPRRHLLPALLAVAPSSAVAVVVAYQADALARPRVSGPQAAAQGHRVLIVVGACSAAAALLRWLLVVLVDRRLDRRRPLRRRATAGIAAAVVLGAGVAFLAAGGPGYAERQYDRFVQGSSIQIRGDQRTRLTDPGNNGRLDHWRVALAAFDTQPLRGVGAGTYQVWWARLRRSEFDVVNAHSLYLETLGEGGIVGLALLAAALLVLAGGMLRRLGGDERALWGTVGAATLVWLLVAGIDWIWQMPAASVWVFALGGAALSRRSAAVVGERRAGSAVRLVAGLAVLVVAVTPVRVALSQTRLADSVNALRQGDCGRAVSAALSSAEALGARAEPYEILGYCDARLGYGPLSIAMIERAIQRDPGNWEYRYDLALVRGAAGRDPRPAIRRARELNPLSGMLIRAERGFAGDSPAKWRRRALRSRLLLPRP